MLTYILIDVYLCHNKTNPPPHRAERRYRMNKITLEEAKKMAIVGTTAKGRGCIYIKLEPNPMHEKLVKCLVPTDKELTDDLYISLIKKLVKKYNDFIDTLEFWENVSFEIKNTKRLEIYGNGTREFAEIG
nr:MAG TPA: hypothetical protein [Caudoviricetes sp.]